MAAIGAHFAVPALELFGQDRTPRGKQCSAMRAADCAAYQRGLTAAKDRILAASKVIRSDKAYDLYETPSGQFWIPSGAAKSYMLPFNLAEQEVQIYGDGGQKVRRGDIVLDCGANVGVFTRKALEAGARKVIAIEPAPENLECLRRNFAGEIATGMVMIVPKGVWNKDDVMTLHVDPANSAADSFIINRKGSVGIIKVPLTTIDRLVDDLALERVDFIKMDIEGAEPNALTGALQTIKRWKPRISVSVYHQDDHPVAVPRIIKAARPDYLMECATCQEVKGRIRPDIIWFR